MQFMNFQHHYSTLQCHTMLIWCSVIVGALLIMVLIIINVVLMNIKVFIA